MDDCEGNFWTESNSTSISFAMLILAPSYSLCISSASCIWYHFTHSHMKNLSRVRLSEVREPKETSSLLHLLSCSALVQLCFQHTLSRTDPHPEPNEPGQASLEECQIEQIGGGTRDDHHEADLLPVARDPHVLLLCYSCQISERSTPGSWCDLHKNAGQGH